MKSLKLRTDFNTIGDFKNEFAVINANKWRGIQQISNTFFQFFYFSVCTFSGIILF